MSHFALIQRPTYDGVHSGQVALPGGKQEEGESLQTTALRETHEEIGIASQQVKIIGELTQIYVAPSKFFITPFIGLYDRRPEFVIDNYEVEEVLEVEFCRLLAKDVIKETEVTVRAGTIGTAQVTAPYFDLNEKVVWGATAAILSELRQAVLALASRQ
jgi:8-oxo-dGTP pyrophosphatase MutT (NUDIX family)